MPQDTLQQFLHYTDSQKNVSLILANDKAEQRAFLKILTQEGFQKVDTISRLLKETMQVSKVFYVIRDALPNQFYDFIVQYSTRHMTIYDYTQRKFLVANPIYTNVSIVFVVTKDMLKKIHEEGFSLLDKVGLTYQS